MAIIGNPKILEKFSIVQKQLLTLETSVKGAIVYFNSQIAGNQKKVQRPKPKIEYFRNRKILTLLWFSLPTTKKIENKRKNNKPKVLWDVTRHAVAIEKTIFPQLLPLFAASHPKKINGAKDKASISPSEPLIYKSNNQQGK